MHRPRYLKLFPIVIFMALGGCGGGGSHVTATTSAGSAAGNTSGNASGTIQLATATQLNDGSTVGMANWPAGSTGSGGQGQPVNSLTCGQAGNAYTYAHLSIFQNGKQLAVPENIGTVAPTQTAQTGCVYPLHTDDASGKIRMDVAASASTPFTLGQFFAVWGQPLSAAGAAGLEGAVTAYINDGGTLTQYHGDPAALALTPHREITLVIGSAPAQIPAYQWADPPSAATTPVVLNETSVGATTWADGDTASGGHGETIDGIECANMTENYHVHTHLAIIKDGRMLAIPAKIGIASACNYEIHTHNPSGELHVESSAFKHFTLGQFFKIWGQPLSATNVAGMSGQPMKFYVSDNGDLREYAGDPAAIELTSHRAITIQIGAAPASVPTYTWDTTQ